MATSTKNSDITVRGGVINVPHSTIPTHPPHHQPNTPRTKKHTTTRSDYQLSTIQPPTPPEEPTPTPAAPPVPPPDEPETDSPE